MTEEITEAVTVEDTPVEEVAQVEAVTDKPEAKTVLDDPSDKPNAPQDWPSDWRGLIAGKDEKLGKRLERFKSPNDVFKSYTELEKKLSESGKRPTLAEDASEEEVAAYRKEAGIPEKPEGYLENLPEGLVIGEDDKDIVEGFIAQMHGKNADPSVVAASIDWYYKTQEAQQAHIAESDKSAKLATEDMLRGEWGPEFRGNINSITSFLESAPVDDDGNSLKDQIMGARLADGTPLGSNAQALNWLLKLANDENPAGFVSPGAGGSQIESVKDEIASIEKVMRTDRKAYDSDEKMQARLRQLYVAEEKLSAA